MARWRKIVYILVVIALLIKKPLLLYRRHLGGPNKPAEVLARHLSTQAQGASTATIRPHCSRTARVGCLSTAPFPLFTHSLLCVETGVLCRSKRTILTQLNLT